LALKSRIDGARRGLQRVQARAKIQISPICRFSRWVAHIWKLPGIRGITGANFVEVRSAERVCLLFPYSTYQLTVSLICSSVSLRPESLKQEDTAETRHRQQPRHRFIATVKNI
jgi:hypothetical protein